MHPSIQMYVTCASVVDKSDQKIHSDTGGKRLLNCLS
jgi:hypothetical protein